MMMIVQIKLFPEGDTSQMTYATKTIDCCPNCIVGDFLRIY